MCYWYLDSEKNYLSKEEVESILNKVDQINIIENSAKAAPITAPDKRKITLR
mgnify:CR=1 FL=1